MVCSVAWGVVLKAVCVCVCWVDLPVHGPRERKHQGDSVRSELWLQQEPHGRAALQPQLGQCGGGGGPLQAAETLQQQQVTEACVCLCVCVCVCVCVRVRALKPIRLTLGG